MNIIEANTTVKSTKKLQTQHDDFTILLRDNYITYNVIGSYLQTDKISKSLEWILHISVIEAQFEELLLKLLPILKQSQAPFRIPGNRATLKNILDGSIGYDQIGKTISIYPSSASIAVHLSEILIPLTQQYKGPDVPTDAHVGGLVYTRYGSGDHELHLNPDGSIAKLAYNTNGVLVEDSYKIPFTLPPGIPWPFPNATVIKTSGKDISILKGNKHSYKITKILKPDARGFVYKAFFFKYPLIIKKCVIKQGRKSMNADPFGRDLKDKLTWQQQLAGKIQNQLRIPKVLELFESEGDTYLVTEFIEGQTLHDYHFYLTEGQKSFTDISPAEKSELLEYILQTIDITTNLHKIDVIHRDINPANFMIDQNKKLIVLDTELAYSITDNFPDPPFGVGTPGHMSEQQKNGEQPTIKEDIFGLSTTIIHLLTGIYPIKLNLADHQLLLNLINMTASDENISEILTAGVHPDPASRPNLPQIKTAVQQLLQSNKIEEKRSTADPSNIIQQGINGITKPPTAMWQSLWLSKPTETAALIGNQQSQYAILPGLYNGIAGVLYYLAKAASCNTDITTALKHYENGWQFLKNNVLPNPQFNAYDLFQGRSGIALSISAGVKAHLIENNAEIRNIIQNCFNEDTHYLGLYDGMAGQAAALIACKNHLTPTFFEQKLEDIVNKLLTTQQKNGSWPALDLNFSKGVPGIIWLLCTATDFSKNKDLYPRLEKSVQYLSNQQMPAKDIDTILPLLKYYEISRDTKTEQLLQKTLNALPAHPIGPNFTQAGGLAETGEIYLEAHRILKNDEWLQRAEWIRDVFINTRWRTQSDTCHWLADKNPIPTAEFLTGNTGILHFLSRLKNPDKLGYRLLT